jgi:phenylalanyl-tRNA synthetase beta subunit
MKPLSTTSKAIKMQTKKEFLAERKIEYKKLKKANKLATKLESQISEIRSLGYKLIVLGSRVKITIGK